MRRRRVVCIGGGTGQSQVLRCLSRYPLDITALVGVTDNGGHSGQLRRIFGIPQVGDIRNCLASMADDKHLFTELLKYRFTEGDLEGVSLGNLLVSALIRTKGSLSAGIEALGRELGVPHTILPVSDHSTQGQKDGEEINIKARRGVVLACGGFENNSEMKLQYFELQPVYPVYLGNTGDGILMAQKIGAALWHMWHFHGGYGFKYAEFPFAIRHVWAGPRKNDRKMVWIAVDRYGRRFMNEYPPAPQDTGARPLEYYDPDIQDYPRVPCYLIFDEEARKLGPLAMVIVNDERYHYRWSEDNSVEIEKGWIMRGTTLREIADKIKVPTEELESTVERWNQNCQNGSDPDFKRPPKTMMPIATPPYYAMEAWPIVSNTQGGLAHDADQRVLDPLKKPIPHLYVAGELSSIFGHLYLEAGNITEAFIGGRIAGQNAAKKSTQGTS